VKTLSGGNLQKVVIAREISREPSLLVISQPTRGTIRVLPRQLFNDQPLARVLNRNRRIAFAEDDQSGLLVNSRSFRRGRAVPHVQTLPKS